MIQGRQEIQNAYRDEQVARRYVERRFHTPLGALLHARQVASLIRVIREHGIERAAELAPGPARLTVDIAPHLRSVTLLDASLQMLEEARRRLRESGAMRRVRLVQADAFNLPLDGPLDLLYTFRLIRHFERADRLRIYREVRRVLRPGGRLVFDAVNEKVSAPMRANARPGEYLHYDALQRPAELRQELHEAGLALESLNGVQYRASWLTRCQVYVGPRSATAARTLMEIIDRVGGGEPLEWIVVCRRV